MKKRKLSDINKPTYLLCDICNTPVYNYEMCTKPHTYCSRDCYEVLVLSQKNDYIDVKDLKRVKSEENIMKLDDQFFCSICETIHSEKDRGWCESVEKYEKESSWDSD